MSVPEDAKIYKVTECDYVVATSPEEATEFLNTQTKYRPDEVLDNPIFTPGSTLIYTKLPEEIEEEESQARADEDDNVYRDESYNFTRPRTLNEALELHFSQGFNMPAFIYCSRHWIHKYELPTEGI